MGYQAHFYELATGGHSYGKDYDDMAAFISLGYAFLRCCGVVKAVNVKHAHRSTGWKACTCGPKPPRRRVMAKLREDRSNATGPNQVWVMDWMHDELFDGRRLWIPACRATYHYRSRRPEQATLRQPIRYIAETTDTLWLRIRGAGCVRSYACRAQRNETTQRNW